MPVTTRAAALRSQANGDLIYSQDQAALTLKTTRKCLLQQKSFDATLTSLAFLVGDLIRRGNRGEEKKNNVSLSNSSHSSLGISSARE